ncbi:MAG: DUF4139 domain-containing protein [Candidatus Lokiarchaeota archaeon]|nr:DUF4139 domain-containing protein [Candidatus Lokiarchaeota archaeon]
MQETELLIDEVILQPDNTIIRRKGTINLVQGLNQIDIGDLDPELDPDSIQLIVSGKNIIIHNIKFNIKTIKSENNLETLHTNEKRIKNNITELNKKISDLDFYISTFDNLQDLFAEKFPNGYTKAKISIDAYSEFLDYIESELTRLIDEKNEIQSHIQELKDKLKEIRKEINEKSEVKKRHEKGHLNLNIESSMDQKAEVQLSYVLNAGKWNMFYELELKEDDIILTKWVMITNTSNEAWNEIKLTLTDKVRSEISIDPPVLTYIDPEKGIESDFLIPVQSIKLPTKVSINNDSRSYRFEIGKEEIKSSRYFYHWNACDFADVISVLVISLNNYLYPAMINVFDNGIYLDSVNHMDFVPPGEEIGIPIKPMKIIKTSKRALNKDIKRIGLLKKQVEVDYEYLLSIENPFDRPLEITVYERIPKPLKKGSEIPLSIDYKDISEIPYKVFENGYVRWDLEIEPKKIQEIDFKIRLLKGES